MWNYSKCELCGTAGSVNKSQVERNMKAKEAIFMTSHVFKEAGFIHCVNNKLIIGL
jgi:hypothetical protein